MKSKIYTGFVEHSRLQPVAHTFQYPIYFYGLDLDELVQLDQTLFLFGYNRRRPVSIHDKDYLDDHPGGIKKKLIRILKEKDSSLSVTSIFMVTSARYLNYVFNPVSFYYCFDQENSITAMVAEVNNTFGERHVYIPEKTQISDKTGDIEKYHTEKVFHVSPFNNMGGMYNFYFPMPGKNIDIRIELIREKNTVFSARLFGAPIELTSANLIRTMLRHPIIPHLTKPRIFMEAARLYFSKRLKYHDKPEPISPMTIKRSH